MKSRSLNLFNKIKFFLLFSSFFSPILTHNLSALLQIVLEISMWDDNKLLPGSTKNFISGD